MNIPAALFLILTALPSQAQESKIDKNKITPQLMGGVVKSDQWLIRKKAGEEEFEGHVSYRNPHYSFNGDWALYNEKTGVVKAKGHIKGEKRWENGDITRMAGDYAQYHPELRKGVLFADRGKQVDIVHDDRARGLWHARSDRADIYDASNVLWLTGKVRIEGQDTNSLSDKAVYVSSAATLNLLGRPAIWGRRDKYDYAIESDRAALLRNEKVVRSEGDVKGWIRPVDPKEAEKWSSSSGEKK